AVAKAVQRQEVHFLDARGLRVRDADVDVLRSEELADLSAAAARERDHPHFTLVGRRERPGDILGVTAGRDREKHVPRLAESVDLLGEPLLVFVVVRDRCQRRGVGRERNRRETRPLPLEAVEQLGGKMLSVRGGTAVSAGEDLPVCEQRLHHDADGVGDRLGQNLVRLELELGAVVEMAADAREQVHVVLGGTGCGYHAGPFYRESSRGERIPYPLDPRRIDVVEQDDVEPARSLARCSKVVPRGGDDSRLLAFIDAVRRATEGLRTPQPDLREDQRVAVPENEVDFSPAGTVSGLDHAEALALQILGGDPLGAIAGVHFALSSGTPTPSRNTACTGSRRSALPPR